MRNVVLIIAVLVIAPATAFQPRAAAAQTVAVTNIEIRMVKTSKRPPPRVTAQTRNPNDFAVRDVEFACTIKDRNGKDVASYTSVIHGVFQPNQRTTTKNLDIGAWPEQGYAALCISRRGTRIAPAAAPPAASVPPSAQAPAPARP